MSTPDAEDANQTDPDLETDYADLDMAEQKDKSSSRDGSPSQPASADKKPSNAKDPLRPRRKKARRACFACQRAHLTCGKHPHLVLYIQPVFHISWLVVYIFHFSSKRSLLDMSLIFSFRRRTALSQMHQARSPGSVP